MTAAEQYEEAASRYTPEDLDRAADEVSKPNGWRQGSWGAWDVAEGRVCAVGAIARVAFASRRQSWSGVSIAVAMVGLTEDLRSLSALCAPDDQDALMQGMSPGEVDRHLFSVTTYNDYPGRTAGEVADLLRTGAERLREYARSDDACSRSGSVHDPPYPGAHCDCGACCDDDDEDGYQHCWHASECVINAAL